jgi:DNA-directed DNA polymerase III PolC
LFTHLRARSYYSFLHGLASPAELAQAAKSAGMPALALTDHLWLSGAVEFYEACRASQVKPILGLDVMFEPPPGSFGAPSYAGRLALLALDLNGWASLCRLSSAVLGGQPAPLPFVRLAQNSQGLLCLSGGRGGLAARLIRDGREADALACIAALQDIFPDRFYIEVQRHSPDDQAWVAGLSALAAARGLPLVATHDVYYLQPGQADLQRLVTAIRLNCRLGEAPAEETAPPGAHFVAAAEMAQRFADLPEALGATQEIAERCRLELPIDSPHYPQMPAPAGMTPDDLLQQKARAGARRLYGEITAELENRLSHELQAIESYGYASIFLIMEEIVQFARGNGVPMSSRGSAASSLVAHCLGITSPDPLRLNLYFERFLNPARHTPPDIDTDLCSRRRDAVIYFVYDRFGADKVAMVCTVNRFRRRSALREVAKAHGLPSQEISAMADALPHRWFGPRLKPAQSDLPYPELAGRYRSPHYQQIFQQAHSLLGLPHHLSIHPGGIVIAPGVLTDLAPTQLAAKGVVITQLDLDSVERLGLVKLDLLGIRGLTVMGDVAETIAAGKGESITGVLDAIPQDDPSTAELVRTGRTVGCFQIESPGMRATLREIQARSVDDIMVALALYRPGPLTGGLKDAFVRRHRGEEQVSHLHPALAPLLDDTYGVILYQEQVLRIAHELAGLSLADADLLRRAMSHFDPGKQMQSLKQRFIAGAASCSAVPPEAAERVWELMVAFAGYGFPKAHAASYAQVSWRAAWCKAHHPAVFMAAVLANWGGYYGQREYLMEVRRMGLALRPPHVNHAQAEFSVSYPEGEPVLFMGLDQVRDLTRRTQERIQRLRPFHSFSDFVARVDPRPVEAENLALAGALEGFGSIPALLARVKSGAWRGGQLSLFSLDAAPGEDWSLEERVAAEGAVLGISVSADPLELYAAQISAAGALTTVEAASHLGQTVRIAGMRQGWRSSQAEAGERLHAMPFGDLEGSIEVVVPSAVYRRYREEISARYPLLVEGVVELDMETGEPFIRAGRLWRLV